MIYDCRTFRSFFVDVVCAFFDYKGYLQSIFYSDIVVPIEKVQCFVMSKINNAWIARKMCSDLRGKISDR